MNLYSFIWVASGLQIWKDDCNNSVTDWKMTAESRIQSVEKQYRLIGRGCSICALLTADSIQG